MIITFYKNCILNDSYAEVVDVFKVDENGKTGLDRYLNSLIQKEINLENVYLTEEGKLSFELENDLDLSYNYMKLKDNLFTRYCFIDDMQIINNLLLVNYSLDVWSTYASQSHIRNSLLSHSLCLSYGSGEDSGIYDYRLPINYVSYRKPELMSLSRTLSNVPKVYAIVTLQVYKTAESGEVTYRSVLTGVLKNFPAESDKLYFDYTHINLELLMQLLIYSSGSTFDNGLYDDLKYEITNLYVIPKDFFENVITNTNGDIGTIKLNTGSNTIVQIPISYIDKEDSEDYNKLGQIKHGKDFLLDPISLDLKDKFKIKSVGTFSSQFDINTIYSNGLVPNARIETGYSWDFSTFKLFLGLNGNYYDVTKDFEIEFPIDVETASSTQLKAITRAINNNKLDLERGRSVFNTIGGMSQTAMKSGGQVGKALSITSEFGNGVVDLLDIANDEELLNNTSFTSNRSSENFNIPSVNVYFGLCQRVLSDPANASIVENELNNIGFKIHKYINDEIFEINYANRNYDIIKFDFVNLYGDFSQSIMKRLKAILLNGVRIWKDVI